MDRIRPAYDSFAALAVTYGIDILIIVILAVGWWISNIVANALAARAPPHACRCQADASARQRRDVGHPRGRHRGSWASRQRAF